MRDYGPFSFRIGSATCKILCQLRYITCNRVEQFNPAGLQKGLSIELNSHGFCPICSLYNRNILSDTQIRRIVSEILPSVSNFPPSIRRDSNANLPDQIWIRCISSFKLSFSAPDLGVSAAIWSRKHAVCTWR